MKNQGFWNTNTGNGGFVYPIKEEMINFDGNIGMTDMSDGWVKLINEYLPKLAINTSINLKSKVYRINLQESLPGLVTSQSKDVSELSTKLI